MPAPHSNANAMDSVEKQDLDSSEDEHFSDAPEGKQSSPASVPATRVERVDDVASHGEVPGTAAHDMRLQDAQPDELEIIPEFGDGESRDSSSPIPQTVVEKVDPDSKRHGEEPGTLAHDLRRADAAPDTVTQAPEASRTDLDAEVMNDEQHMRESLDSEDEAIEHNQNAADDDFDDFEEGDEADDFGTFDVEDDQRQPMPESSVDISKPSLALFDFEGLESVEDIATASEPYLRELFPSAYQDEHTDHDELAEINPSFLTERSQSLWAQLIAPPPLQPPDWIRSRIRRLFLVSLGVPVDLDEILPASKQKKLILPSIEIDGESSRSQAEDSRSGGPASKLKQSNASAASLASTPSKSERKKRGPAPPPDLDLNAARLKCTTTDAAMKNFTAAELKEHVSTLDEYKNRAGKLLEFWLIKKDSANGDKEAFEEVIENLVKHAKKIRK